MYCGSTLPSNLSSLWPWVLISHSGYVSLVGQLWLCPCCLHSGSEVMVKPLCRLVFWPKHNNDTVNCALPLNLLLSSEACHTYSLAKANHRATPEFNRTGKYNPLQQGRNISGHMTKSEVSGVKSIILWQEGEKKYWE